MRTSVAVRPWAPTYACETPGVDVLLVVAVAVAMAVGIVGTVLPLVPGLPVVWAAALVYGLGAGFGSVGWVAFGAISIFFVAGMIAGIVLPQRSLAAVGAPRSTMLAGLVGAVVGFFVVPIVGLPLGAAVGVWMAERARLEDAGAAWRSTRSLLLGFGAGALTQVLAGLAMTAVWVGWVVLG